MRLIIAKLELGNETYASLKKQQWNQLSDQAELHRGNGSQPQVAGAPDSEPSACHCQHRRQDLLKMLAFNTAKAQVLISALMQSQRPEAQQALCRLADHFLKRAIMMLTTIMWRAWRFWNHPILLFSDGLWRRRGRRRPILRIPRCWRWAR
jgi:hypothetical protein